ncbi:MAG: caspase family protein, partial [Nitrospirota bacterium]
MTHPHNKQKKLELSGRRLALIICNGSFTNIPEYKLIGPSKDAKLLESVLSDMETCRFSVRALVNKGLIEVRREIARICEEAGKEDTLLIYYSGNGIRNEDGLFLLVTDSESDYLYATALESEFIISQLRRSKCRKIVLIVDSCHAGAFFDNNRGIPSGLYAITSCGADEYCADTPDGGTFTIAVCTGLRGSAADTDGDGMVSIDELHEFVKESLRAEKHSNTPQKWV